MILWLGCVADTPRLTVVGDVVLARDVAAEIGRRGDPWAGLRPAVGEVRVGNLEGSVAVGPCVRTDGNCLGFDAPALDWVRDAGFAAMSVENNHADDHGEEGRAATREALLARGITPIAAGAPVSLEAGSRWGLVAADLSTGDPENLEQALLDVATAAARDPRVVVLPHWGDELEPRIRPIQARIAETFRAWGATAVIGSGAHVPGPVDCALGTWFNLGNHLMDQRPEETWTGSLVRCAPDGACRTSTSRRTAHSVFPSNGSAGERCTLPARPPPDRAWLAHTVAGGLIGAARLPDAGPDAWVALRRLRSTFDDQEGLRPYVFDLRDGRVDDLWRGTALARPIALAAPVDGVLCALLRGDSFLAPDPSNTERTWTSWRWNGFGFSSEPDASRCAEVLDPAGLLARG